MTATAAHTPHTYLSEPLRLEAPDVCGPLAVFPIFGAAPRLEYVSFAEAREHGLAIKELRSGASVNDLTVHNPTATAVLLYEGEEVLGAQQNRTFDLSVLVPAGAMLRVPVSCVEHGRWDGSRHDESFAPAPQAAYPDLRRMKNRQARASADAGDEPRAIQSAVWQELADKSSRLGTAPPTGAMHDIYGERRPDLLRFRSAVTRRDGQLGALLAIGGRFSVLDYVSRADVYAALHGPLVEGYALDALEAADAPAPALEAAQAFVTAVMEAPLSRRKSIGAGHDARFSTASVGGAGLVADEELIQLTAFADDDTTTSSAGSRATRIRRPSRRRDA